MGVGVGFLDAGCWSRVDGGEGWKESGALHCHWGFREGARGARRKGNCPVTATLGAAGPARLHPTVEACHMLAVWGAGRVPAVGGTERLLGSGPAIVSEHRCWWFVLITKRDRVGVAHGSPREPLPCHLWHPATLSNLSPSNTP